MLRVPLHKAKPGMKLAMTVTNPDRPDTALLRDGYVLDTRSIARLQELSYRHVWIDYPSLSFLAKHFSPAVAESRSEMTGKISGVFAEFARERYAVLDYGQLGGAVADLLEALVEEPASALLLDQFGIGCGESTRHSINVTFLSLLMGLKLGDYIMSERARVSGTRARDFGALGLGAMLHDIGMLSADPDAVKAWRETGEMDDSVRSHVHSGFGLVRGKIKPSAAAAVLHHHQRRDGSGFPVKTLLDGTERALQGSEIHIFARIVGIADEFDRRLTGSDGIRERSGHDRSRVEVLQSFRDQSSQDAFDPMVLAALFTVCPPYPPGSIVGVSTGMTGVVVSWNPLDPCRPIVRRMDPDDPSKLYEEEIDLAEETDAAIVRADDADVSAFNFYPETPHEFDIRGAASRAVNRADEFQQSA